MMPKTETSGDDAAEEWSTPVNCEKDPSSRQNGEVIINKCFALNPVKNNWCRFVLSFFRQTKK